MIADKQEGVHRLEDFGVRNATTAEERLATYQEQGRGLPKTKQALFWSGVLKSDPEVAKLCKANGTPYHVPRGGPKKSKRARSYKSDFVPLHKEVGQVEENGVCQ
jgi:hypothetical protein